MRPGLTLVFISSVCETTFFLQTKPLSLTVTVAQHLLFSFSISEKGFFYTYTKEEKLFIHVHLLVSKKTQEALGGLTQKLGEGCSSSPGKNPLNSFFQFLQHMWRSSLGC